MTLRPHDCTWYWTGGALAGEWRVADLGTAAACRRMGYVAHEGYRDRRPTAPPSASAINAVLTRVA